MTSLRAAACLALILTTSACVAGPASNELNIDNDGGGRFSGHAGPDWTEAELRQMVGAQVCGGASPRQFNLRVLSGNWLFSGTC
jgi:hypothetical protein